MRYLKICEKFWRPEPQNREVNQLTLFEIGRAQKFKFVLFSRITCVFFSKQQLFFSKTFWNVLSIFLEGKKTHVFLFGLICRWPLWKFVVIKNIFPEQFWICLVSFWLFSQMNVFLKQGKHLHASKINACPLLFWTQTKNHYQFIKRGEKTSRRKIIIWKR